MIASGNVHVKGHHVSLFSHSKIIVFLHSIARTTQAWILRSPECSVVRFSCDLRFKSDGSPWDFFILLARKLDLLAIWSYKDFVIYEWSRERSTAQCSEWKQFQSIHEVILISALCRHFSTKGKSFLPSKERPTTINYRRSLVVRERYEGEDQRLECTELA